MEDSLLDGIDESPRFVEGTQGLSLTEVVSVDSGVEALVIFPSPTLSVYPSLD
jgi:hypothetical protein